MTIATTLPSQTLRLQRWLVLSIGLTLVPAQPAPLSAAIAIGPPPGELTAADDEHPLRPLLRWGRRGIPALAELKDYTATLVTRERLQGKLGRRRGIRLKIRHRPFSVYAGVVDGQGVVREEAIYVAGENNGRVWAHSDDHRWVGTIALRPDSPWAQRDSRYPLTEAGLLALLTRIVADAESEVAQRQPEVKTYDDTRIEGRPCLCATVTHTKRLVGDTFYHARIFIDKEYHVPVRFESYVWPPDAETGPRLKEEFTYLDLQFNVGLTDADFDLRNSAYRFPPPRQQNPVAAARPREGQVERVNVIQELSEPSPPLVATSKQHSLAMQLCRTALSELRQRKGYTCRLFYRVGQQVDARLRELEIRVRHEPLSVYVIEQGASGREAMFVAGANDERVLVRRRRGGEPATRVFRLFAPSRMVTTDAGQVLTELGMRAQLRELLQTHEPALLAGATDVRFYRPALVDGRQCTCLELASPHARLATTTLLSRVFFDDAWRVPIRFERYSRSSQQPQQLEFVSATTYRDIEWRDDLQDADFRFGD